MLSGCLCLLYVKYKYTSILGHCLPKRGYRTPKSNLMYKFVLYISIIKGGNIIYLCNYVTGKLLSWISNKGKGFLFWHKCVSTSLLTTFARSIPRLKPRRSLFLGEITAKGQLLRLLQTLVKENHFF